MSLRLAALALLLTLVARPAVACPEPAGGILFHSCWGEAGAQLLLLPEDLPVADPPGEALRLVVTGAYTGADKRGEEKPNPVGLFLREGEVVNRNLARMDGILIVDPETGELELHHRARLKLGGQSYDLRNLARRRAFIEAAHARNLSVMQSHLLIAGGDVDVSPQEGAPAHVRRMLFSGLEGFGVWQSPMAMTLHDATLAVDEALGPEMVMNLDMGSYDFCRRAEGGAEADCGTLAPEGTAKLSNLLVLTLR